MLMARFFSYFSQQQQNTITRRKFLLGTYVDISVEYDARQCRYPQPILQIIDLAFNKIAHIHKLMSFQDTTSELNLINSQISNGQLENTISKELAEVLSFSLYLSKLSDGAFDITASTTASSPEKMANWHNICLTPLSPSPSSSQLTQQYQLYCHEQVKLNLGGVAKGYAVDQAFELIMAYANILPIDNVSVNAGGDLRSTDYATTIVHSWGEYATSLTRQHQAIATTSNCYRQEVIDPHSNDLQIINHPISVTAMYCMFADALTKVVANAPHIAKRVLEQLDAKAYITKQGVVTSL
jgi:thiamine biosynthesis lipoprotein